MHGLTVLILILAIFPANVYSWWSKGPLSTHAKISQAAVSLLNDTTAYPDIERFGATITGATSTQENDEIAHGKEDNPDDAGKYNGGDFQEWWRKAKDELYKNSRFSGDLNAYFRIGSMAHLVPDQAVPAHAANIFHAQTTVLDIPTNFDDLEMWAGGNGPTFVAESYFGKEPLVYYYYPEAEEDSLIRRTRVKFFGWRYPPGGEIEQWRGRRYWIENGLDPYTGDAFFGDLSNTSVAGGWGYYGGPSGTDMYVYFSRPEWYSAPVDITASPEIASDQINEATAYTVGMLKAVSESLPPVVQSPSINGVSGSTVAVNPGLVNNIKFTLLDNRTRIVTYRLLVDEHDPSSSNDIISTQTLVLQDNPDLTSLPYSSATTVAWNGKLASGSSIKALADGGPHTLYIIGKDEDDNSFDYVVGSFTVAGGPLVTVDVIGANPYTAFSGIDVGTHPAYS